MRKITDLTETKLRTVYRRDAYGNRERDVEEITVRREVKSVSEGPRFGHFIIDLIAFQILVYTVSYLFDLLGFIAVSVDEINITVNYTIVYIKTLIGLLLYPAFYFTCEYLWQKTPAKFLTKNVVIDVYANKPSARQVVLRSLIRLVPFEAFSCFGKHTRGWHDKWADTWVVPEHERDELKKLIMQEDEE